MYGAPPTLCLTPLLLFACDRSCRWRRRLAPSCVMSVPSFNLIMQHCRNGRYVPDGGGAGWATGRCLRLLPSHTPPPLLSLFSSLSIPSLLQVVLEAELTRIASEADGHSEAAKAAARMRESLEADLRNAQREAASAAEHAAGVQARLQAENEELYATVQGLRCVWAAGCHPVPSSCAQLTLPVAC